MITERTLCAGHADWAWTAGRKDPTNCHLYFFWGGGGVARWDVGQRDRDERDMAGRQADRRRKASRPDGGPMRGHNIFIDACVPRMRALLLHAWSPLSAISARVVPGSNFRTMPGAFWKVLSSTCSIPFSGIPSAW